MARRTTSRTRLTPRATRNQDDQTTRQKLLEAAGQVFAEKGFDRATGKEICERAGTNNAAVNYYFGGIAGLYEAVLQEVPSRLVTIEAITAAVAVAGKGDAKAKLESFIGLLVRTLTGPSSSWVLRVIAREMVAPSSTMDNLREKGMYPAGRIVRGIVGELMGLPEDHPAVARGCVSVTSPFLMLLICDRRTLRRLFPHLGFDPGDTEALIRHLVQFTLAGLTAVAADACRKSKP